MSAATVYRPRRIPDRVRVAREYQAYLEARYGEAEEATRGVLVNADGERRGISPRSTWFSGRNGTLRYASEELADYFEAYGRPLTRAEWRLWQTDPSDGDGDDAAAHDVVADDAGVRHVVAYREWADVAYTVCDVWCDPAVSGAPSGVECVICGPMLPPDSEPARDGDVATDADQGPGEIIGPVTADGVACAACSGVPRRGTLTVAADGGVARWCVACTARAMQVGPVTVRLEAGRHRPDPVPDPVPAPPDTDGGGSPTVREGRVAVATGATYGVATCTRWGRSRAGPPAGVGARGVAVGAAARDDERCDGRGVRLWVTQSRTAR